MSPQLEGEKGKKNSSSHQLCTHLIIAASAVKFLHADDNAGTHTSSELFIAILSFNASHLPGFLAGFVCFTMLPFKSLSINQTEL